MRITCDDRISWIDWAKVIGIVLVVYAHIPSEIVPIIFLFHMPFFFIISGYLYKDRSFLEELKRTFYILFPYFIYNLILLVIYPPPQVVHGMINILLGNQEQLPIIYVPMWFVICLVNMRLIYSALSNPSFKMLISLLLLALFVVLKEFDYIQRDKDYFQLNSTMLSYHFFVFGYYLRYYHKIDLINKLIEKNGKKKISVLLIIIMLMAIMIGCVNAYYGKNLNGHGMTNLFRCVVGYSLFISLLVAYIISYCIILLLHLYLNFDLSVIKTISNGTLLILCTHLTVLYWLQLLFDSSKIGIPLLLTIVVMSLSYLLILLSSKYFPLLIGKKCNIGL